MSQQAAAGDSTFGFVRLRVEVPDHPGALAAVGRVLASNGLNVVEVSIHEVEGARAVDEIVVHGGAVLRWADLAPALRTAGAELLSVAPCDMRGDPVVTAMTWVTASIAAPARRGALHTGVRLLTGLDNAHVVTRDEAMRLPVAAAAVMQGRVVVQRLAQPPEPLRSTAGEAGSGMWVLAAPDGPEATFVVLAARPYAVRFTATEINRLLAVLDCRRQLVQARLESVPAP